MPITTLENCAVERSKEVAAEMQDEEVSVTIQEHIERSKEVKEEPVMMIGKAGNTVTERVKELERDPGDVETKENDPPNGGSCGKSGASLKTAPGDKGGSIADGERQEDTAECGTRHGAWERTGGESERLADV